jgi:hypothetical protein
VEAIAFGLLGFLIGDVIILVARGEPAAVVRAPPRHETKRPSCRLPRPPAAGLVMGEGGGRSFVCRENPEIALGCASVGKRSRIRAGHRSWRPS